MPVHLTDAQVQRDLAVRDLTDPAGGRHAIQLVIDRAVRALEEIWPCEVRWCRSGRVGRVVSVEDNYDNLGFDPKDVTRDARYTRYVDDRRMLRSHSSAMVPPALRALAADPDDDVLLVCPGIVFRRDAIDRLRTGTPHQLDLWRITRRPMTDAHLDQMIAALLDAVVPGAARRRLGARVDQKNLLVRVVLRDLDRTLSDGEANEMRDRVYRALHQGTAFEWATRPSCRPG